MSFGIRPARYVHDPPRRFLRIADAIRIGFCFSYRCSLEPRDSLIPLQCSHRTQYPPGVDNDGDLSILQNHFDIEGVADSQPSADGCPAASLRRSRSLPVVWQREGRRWCRPSQSPPRREFLHPAFLLHWGKAFSGLPELPVSPAYGRRGFLCHPAGPHSVLGVIAAGGVRQDGVFFR